MLCNLKESEKWCSRRATLQPDNLEFLVHLSFSAQKEEVIEKKKKKKKKRIKQNNLQRSLPQDAAVTVLGTTLFSFFFRFFFYPERPSEQWVSEEQTVKPSVYFNEWVDGNNERECSGKFSAAQLTVTRNEGLSKTSTMFCCFFGNILEMYKENFQSPGCVCYKYNNICVSFSQHFSTFPNFKMIKKINKCISIRELGKNKQYCCKYLVN